MKAIIYSSVFFLTPFLTFAEGLATGDPNAGKFGPFITAIIGFIDTFLLPLALAIAFIALVWGIVRFFVIGGDSDDGKTKGKQLIIYALVGFVVIFSFYGIINIITNGLGFGGQSLQGLPKVPGAN
jgi:predicted PurR-regulated permease PerM